MLFCVRSKKEKQESFYRIFSIASLFISGDIPFLVNELSGTKDTEYN
jgi:hypothetical protein